MGQYAKIEQIVKDDAGHLKRVTGRRSKCIFFFLFLFLERQVKVYFQRKQPPKSLYAIN